MLFYVLEPQSAFYVVDIDWRRGGVSTPTPASLSVQGVNTYPDWSPTGKRAAYVTQRTHLTAGLAIHDFESGTEQFFPVGNAGPPRWSPDGLTLVFPSASSINVLTVSDGHVTVLPGGPFTGPLPSWSVDGRSILFLDRTRDAVTVSELDPKTGRRQTLFAAAKLGGYSVSNHGKRIAFNTLESSGLVVSVWDAATDTVRELVRVPRGDGMAVAGWSPDDGELILGHSTRGPTRLSDVELLAYPLSGGAPRSIGWVRMGDGDLISGLRLSPTGMRLHFVSSPSFATTWAMEGFLGTAKPAGR